jgi:hypothetical protein
MPLRSSGLTGAAVLAAALLAPAVAYAAEDREISSPQTLSGDQIFRNLTITSTGKITVPKLGTVETGWLHVTANKIIIYKDGEIDASGAGHQGIASADGATPMNTNGGGKYNATIGLPGGGAGFFGAGAPGTQEPTPGTCTPALGSDGGQAFFDMMNASLGAAGGASNTGSFSAAGGAGGGGIILTAAMIQIDGIIRANGLPAPQASSVAAGGGSGGSILLETVTLTGSGKLEAKGGDGTHGSGSTNPANPFPPNNGGGGSGGVVLVKMPGAKAPPSTLQAVLDGGLTGDCPASSGPNGMVVQLDLGTQCVDLDYDGHTSSLCGGDDCDDTDKAINPEPDVVEICDGKDNDCNGTADDEGATPLCSPGTTCTSGKCTAIVKDAGAGGGGTGGSGPGGSSAHPDHYEFGGGCATAQNGLPEGAAGALLLGLGTLALAASRRKSRKRAR